MPTVAHLNGWPHFLVPASSLEGVAIIIASIDGLFTSPMGVLATFQLLFVAP